MKKKLDGRVTAEIGEERRFKFKVALMKRKQTFVSWLIERIDKYLKESEVK